VHPYNVWDVHPYNVWDVHPYNVWDVHPYNVWDVHPYNVWDVHPYNVNSWPTIIVLLRYNNSIIFGEQNYWYYNLIFFTRLPFNFNTVNFYHQPPVTLAILVHHRTFSHLRIFYCTYLLNFNHNKWNINFYFPLMVLNYLHLYMRFYKSLYLMKDIFFSLLYMYNPNHALCFNLKYTHFNI
jgi:hypothetical protein